MTTSVTAKDWKKQSDDETSNSNGETMFNAEVKLDSITPDGLRLATVVATYPRFIHSEVLTHRDRARNSASSRAIPWKKTKPGKVMPVFSARLDEAGITEFCDQLVDNCMAKMILTDPVIPIKWGAEQSGMQTGDEIAPDKRERARAAWLRGMRNAVDVAEELARLGVHKSLCNRVTEPWMWITVVMSATEWKNFFRLRVHKDAEVHFQRVAGMIQRALLDSTPKMLKYGEWHMPFLDVEEREEIAVLYRSGHFDRHALKDALEVMKWVSAARCARVSYLTHDGKRDYHVDVELARKLILRTDDVIHASPLEHTAMCSHTSMRSGPFHGWYQMRKDFPNENVEG